MTKTIITYNIERGNTLWPLILSSITCKYVVSRFQDSAENRPFDGQIIVETAHGMQTIPQRPNPDAFRQEFRKNVPGLAETL